MKLIDMDAIDPETMTRIFRQDEERQMTLPVVTLNNGVTMPPFGLEGIVENIDVFDFTLSSEDIGAIDALDTGGGGGRDPQHVATTLFTMSGESHYAQPTP